MAKEKIVIYTDGGARMNPGPAAIGGVIKIGGDNYQFSEFIGDSRTNNEAEYEALIFALKKTKKLLGKKKAKEAELECYLDSELAVRQLNHQYKLKNEQIKKYFIEIWNLMLDFLAVQFIHVKREKNKEADRLVNEALDKNENKFNF